MTKRTVIIGVGGPVGSGKTLCLSRLTRRMSDLNLAVITNDIYTKEDALFLAKNSSLDEDHYHWCRNWRDVLILRFVRMPL